MERDRAAILRGGVRPVKVVGTEKETDWLIEALAVAGSFYSYTHEFILYGTKNQALQRGGSNVWEVRGYSTGAEKTDGPKLHPAQKPIAIMARCMEDSTQPGDLILDCFAGSGTGAVAAIRGGVAGGSPSRIRPATTRRRSAGSRWSRNRRQRTRQSRPPCSGDGRPGGPKEENMENETNRPDLADLITETARRTVIEYEQRQQARAADNMAHNTAILMENYTVLKDYASKKTAGTAAAWGDAFLESITSSKVRTSIMVAAIDTALAEVAGDYQRRGQGYKYEAFRARYVEGENYETIAERLNSGKNSPARWCKEVMARLAVYLFGVDGLKRW